MAANVRSHNRRNNKTQRVNPVPNSVMSFAYPYKWRTLVGIVAVLFSLFVLLGISSNTLFTSPNTPLKTDFPPIYTVEIVNEFPHDPNAFTQGLLYWADETLYESTGLYGQSTVRKVDLKTGKVETQHKMDRSVFGEGLTLLDERLYQVTWLKKTGFIYERDNFNNRTAFTHHMNDGWGLATDGKILFGSDGSSTLYQLDPHTMKVIQKQMVRYKGLEVRHLNELEFINGEVWANVYTTDCIARLSPSGTIVGWILLPNLRESLIQAGETNFDVLNGIAWDSVKQRIFVTGKLWPKLFEIKLQPMKEHSQGTISNAILIHLELVDGCKCLAWYQRHNGQAFRISREKVLQQQKHYLNALGLGIPLSDISIKTLLETCCSEVGFQAAKLAESGY